MSTRQWSTATCRHDRPDGTLTLLTCTPVDTLALHTYTHTHTHTHINMTVEYSYM